jgi:hypothetical protein
MIPVWHQDNNSARATVADISALLELNNIPFKMESSTTIKDHTCFLVGNKEDGESAIKLITQEDGRFSKELQDLQLTEEEVAVVTAKELATKLALENKQRLYDLRKTQEAAIIASINSEFEDEDDEVTIDELIAQEEKE